MFLLHVHYHGEWYPHKLWAKLSSSFLKLFPLGHSNEKSNSYSAVYSKSGDWQCTKERRPWLWSHPSQQSCCLDCPSVGTRLQTRARTGAGEAPCWVVRAALSVLEHWPQNTEPSCSWSNTALHTDWDTGHHQDLEDASVNQSYSPRGQPCQDLLFFTSAFLPGLQGWCQACLDDLLI